MFSKSDNTDKELVEGLRRSSEACFDKLFIRYSGAIYGICRRFYLTQTDSEEVVQEVFMKVWENRHGLKSGLSFKSYLYTIARNIILKNIRSYTIDYACREYLSRQHSGGENQTENQVFFNQLLTLSEEAINQLSPQRKEVFLMGRFEGMTNEEIASRLGLSKRTVEHHMYHAQKHMRRKMSVMKVSVILLGFFIF